MKQALIDIEDSRFYEHHGVDLEGTRPGAGAQPPRRRGHAGRLDDHPAAGEADACCSRPPPRRSGRRPPQSSIGRKLREARLALALEEQYSKSEILTRYLNLVYFGEGTYGVQAAAQRYFSVNAADLTLPQAAMLAGSGADAVEDDPLADPEPARERRNQVLQRMRDARAHHRRRTSPRSPPRRWRWRRPRPRRTAASAPSRAASSATTCSAT